MLNIVFMGTPDFAEESLGTQNIFLLNPVLLDVLKNGKIVSLILN